MSAVQQFGDGHVERRRETLQNGQCRHVVSGFPIADPVLPCSYEGGQIALAPSVLLA